MKKITMCMVLSLSFLMGCSVHYYSIDNGDISFYLRDKEAKDVHFQYSYDGYQCHEAESTGSGVWQVDVPSVDEFSYFYMVDGKLYVPPCLLTEKDDFGNENCIFSKGM